MQVNTFSRKKKIQRKKIGRGGKKGTYSGRGVKGQKSRSGSKTNPLFEGGRSTLVRRMKKLRGFKSRALPIKEIKISQLGKIFKDNEEVSEKSLRIKGLLKKGKKIKGIKIIKDSEKLSKKLTFSGNVKFSKSAEGILKKSGAKIISSKKAPKASSKKTKKTDKK